MVCWICNGPRCWSQRSVCVCKSDKHKRGKIPITELSGTWSMKRRESMFILWFFLVCHRLLPSTSALICEYQVCTPKLNCCLFYSAGVKAPTCRWMLSGEWGSQDAQLCCWHNTIPERPATWFTQAKCHGNCEDLYQWERADEVPRLSDLTDFNMCSNVVCHTEGGKVDQFYPERSTSRGIDRTR